MNCDKFKQLFPDSSNIDYSILIKHYEECPECRKDLEIINEVKKVKSTERPLEFWTKLKRDMVLEFDRRIKSAEYGIRKIINEWSQPFLKGAMIASVMAVLFVAGYNMQKQDAPQVTLENGQEMEFYLKEHLFSEENNIFVQESFTAILVSSKSWDKK